MRRLNINSQCQSWTTHTAYGDVLRTARVAAQVRARFARRHRRQADLREPHWKPYHLVSTRNGEASSGALVERQLERDEDP